jgi:hypothetical protein
MNALGTLTRDIFSSLVNEYITEQDYKSLRLTCKASKGALNDALTDLVSHVYPSDGPDFSWLDTLQDAGRTFDEFDLDFLTILFDVFSVDLPTSPHLPVTHNTIAYRWEQCSLGFPLRRRWPETFNAAHRYTQLVPTVAQQERWACFNRITDRFDALRIRLQSLRMYATLSFAYDTHLLHRTQYIISRECVTNTDTVLRDNDLHKTLFICMAPEDVVPINTTVLCKQCTDPTNIIEVIGDFAGDVPSMYVGNVVAWEQCITEDREWTGLKRIAIGAKVGLTKTLDMSKNAVRGSFGVVHKIKSGQSHLDHHTRVVLAICVKLDTGSFIRVKRSMNMSSGRYQYKDPRGITQRHHQATFPLVLGYAVTADKLDGIPSDGPVVLVIKDSFRHQELLYLYLSRCQNRGRVSIISSSELGST